MCHLFIFPGQNGQDLGGAWGEGGYVIHTNCWLYHVVCFPLIFIDLGPGARLPVLLDPPGGGGPVGPSRPQLAQQRLHVMIISGPRVLIGPWTTQYWQGAKQRHKEDTFRNQMYSNELNKSMIAPS